MTKTYILKVMSDFEGWSNINAAIDEGYKNRVKVGRIITENLFLPIGEILQFIPDETCTYYKAAKEHEQEPIFKLFLKMFKEKDSNNILNAWLNNSGLDNYESNWLSDTDFKRQGYRNHTFSTFRTTIRSKKPKIKWVPVDENTSAETLIEQIHCEMSEHDISEASDLRNYLENVREKSDPNPSTISRLETLLHFFEKNEKEVMESYERKCVECFQNFRNINFSKTDSVAFSPRRIKIRQTDGNFIVHIGSVDIPVLGSRQLIRDYKEVFNVSEHIAKEVRMCRNAKGEIFLHLTFTGLDKKERKENFQKCVGIDINTKHSLLTTSKEDDGSLIGYVNINKEIAKNKRLTPKQRDYFNEVSRYVTFCPTEAGALLSRCYKDRREEFNKEDAELDLAITESIESLLKSHSDDTFICLYLHMVKKLRAMIKSAYVLQKAYHREQSTYDLAHPDEKDTFALTERGQELLRKMANADNDVIGCRDNIITYAYKLFENNGYTMISLENLTKSSFKSTSFLRTPSYLLNCAKYKGKPANEIREIMTINGGKPEYYDFITDDDNKIVDITFSEKGRRRNDYAYFHNFIIKKVHFASVKDKFLQLSNNGIPDICLVPPQYTSQMDSKTHTLYVNDNGKILPKEKVRRTQEEHINGLNADFNAAKNIEYMISDELFRNTFLKKGGEENDGYSQPVLTTKKGDKSLVKMLAKMGRTQTITL